MSAWRSGDIVSAASGVAMLASLFVPWVTAEAAPARSPVALGQAGLLAWVGVVGLLLLVFGIRRSSWTALVALLSVLVVAFVVFTSAIPAHAPGVHPGFGMYAVAAAGVLAVIGGVLNAIEREGADF